MTWDSMTLGKRFHDMELYDDIKKDSIAENAAFYDMQIRTSKVTKPQIYKYKALKLLKMQNYNNTSNTYLTRLTILKKKITTNSLTQPCFLKV